MGMEFFKDDLCWDYRAKKSLRVLVVGAGIAGLTAAIGLKQVGHDVCILEQMPQITEVGAGIQMAPNAARILGRFGLLDKVLKRANILEKNSLRRWQNNEEIGVDPLMPRIGEKYKAPNSVIHRSSLQLILLERVYADNIDVRLNHTITGVDPNFQARVQVTSGEWIEGDVIIAADGIRSAIRSQMALVYGLKDCSMSTGDAAYRITIPREMMQGDMQALELLDSNVAMRWMGPGGHIMGYPVKLKNDDVYNMVLLHPQNPNVQAAESWTNKGDKKEMIDFYKDWNSLVRNLLCYVPDGEINEWVLNTHQPLPRWVENKCALVGDSCHPMLPYVAQGAAQAMEDAAVLTVALSLTDDVNTALGVYEQIRKPRGEAIQNSAARTRKALHLPDGPEQQERDRAMGGGRPNPDLWANHEWQDFMWGTDVMRDTLRDWDKWVALVEGRHWKS